MKKVLLTSGCSFTQGPNSWPEFLSSALDLKLYNYGQISRGNGYISRSTIYGLRELLKTYSTDEIIVGIMWSGPNRFEFFQSELDESLIDKTSTNPHSFIKEAKKNWVGVNSHWDDHYSKSYYKNFHDDIGQYIYTIEHILRLQWFLKYYKIDYFMTFFTDIVLPKGDIKDLADLKYLFDMIDFSKFVNIKSCIDWCVEESGLPMREPNNIERFNMHPTIEHNKLLAQKILVPFVIENIYPCKEGEKNEL